MHNSVYGNAFWRNDTGLVANDLQQTGSIDLVMFFFWHKPRIQEHG